MASQRLTAGSNRPQSTTRRGDSKPASCVPSGHLPVMVIRIAAGRSSARRWPGRHCVLVRFSAYGSNAHGVGMIALSSTFMPNAAAPSRQSWLRLWLWPFVSRARGVGMKPLSEPSYRLLVITSPFSISSFSPTACPPARRSRGSCPPRPAPLDASGVGRSDTWASTSSPSLPVELLRLRDRSPRLST